MTLKSKVLLFEVAQIPIWFSRDSLSLIPLSKVTLLSNLRSQKSHCLMSNKLLILRQLSNVHSLSPLPILQQLKESWRFLTFQTEHDPQRTSRCVAPSQTSGRPAGSRRLRTRLWTQGADERANYPSEQCSKVNSVQKPVFKCHTRVQKYQCQMSNN